MIVFGNFGLTVNGRKRRKYNIDMADRLHLATPLFYGINDRVTIVVSKLFKHESIFYQCS